MVVSNPTVCSAEAEVWYVWTGSLCVDVPRIVLLFETSSTAQTVYTVTTHRSTCDSPARVVVAVYVLMTVSVVVLGAAVFPK